MLSKEIDCFLITLFAFFLSELFHYYVYYTIDGLLYKLYIFRFFILALELQGVYNNLWNAFFFKLNFSNALFEPIF